MLCRGSRINFDLRRDQPYEIYDHLKFEVPVEVLAVIATTVTS